MFKRIAYLSLTGHQAIKIIEASVISFKIKNSR